MKKKELSKAGRRQELLDRLLIVLIDNVNVREECDTRMYPSPEDGFTGTTNCINLTADNIPVDNPTEEGVRAPTN